MCRTWLGRSHFPGTVAFWIAHGIWDLPLGKDSIQGDGIVDTKAGLIWHASFKELLYQENGCVPITYGTFQDPQGLSYPHKKYWTAPSIIQYYTITLNRVLTQRQVSYAMRDSKSYRTREMAASQSRTVHSKTKRVCPIHIRNIGPIVPLSSTTPSPWIESLHKGRSHMTCGIQRATVPG